MGHQCSHKDGLATASKSGEPASRTTPTPPRTGDPWESQNLTLSAASVQGISNSEFPPDAWNIWAGNRAQNQARRTGRKNGWESCGRQTSDATAREQRNAPTAKLPQAGSLAKALATLQTPTMEQKQQSQGEVGTEESSARGGRGESQCQTKAAQRADRECRVNVKGNISEYSATACLALSGVAVHKHANMKLRSGRRRTPRRGGREGDTRAKKGAEEVAEQPGRVAGESRRQQRTRGRGT